MEAPTRRRLAILLDNDAAAGRGHVASSASERRQLQRAVAQGLALQPYPGVFVSPAHWHELNDQQRALQVMRAVHILRPKVVFAGPSAALVHGLRVGYQFLTPLCQATSASSHAASSRFANRIIVSNDSPFEKDGVLVSSFIRAVFDSLRLLPFADALVVADSVLRFRNIERDRLSDNLLRICRRRPGIRRAVDIVQLSDGRAESGGESVARAQMNRHGFVIPDLQREIPDPLDLSKTIRVDFAWDLPDGTLVIGELDGREKYENPRMTQGRDITDILLKERRRESHLTFAGQHVRIIRFSYREVLDDVYFPKLLDSCGVPRVTHVPEVAKAPEPRILNWAS